MEILKLPGTVPSSSAREMSAVLTENFCANVIPVPVCCTVQEPVQVLNYRTKVEHHYHIAESTVYLYNSLLHTELLRGPASCESVRCSKGHVCVIRVRHCSWNERMLN